MFPVLSFRISQLEPTTMYAVVLEFRCTNQHRLVKLCCALCKNWKYSPSRWRFLNGNWQKGSSCDDDAEMRHAFVHFASIAPGSQWMQDPVSFAKLKLSNRENNTSKVSQPIETRYYSNSKKAESDAFSLLFDHSIPHFVLECFTFCIHNYLDQTQLSPQVSTSHTHCQDEYW